MYLTGSGKCGGLARCTRGVGGKAENIERFLRKYDLRRRDGPVMRHVCTRRLVTKQRSFSIGSLDPFFPTVFLHLQRASTMASKSQRPKGRDGLLSTLDVLIQALSLAKDTCGIPPAQIAIGSANALLSMIRV